MAEPVAPAIVTGLGLGAAASALGMEIGPLFYAAIGATIGVSFAGPMSRVRWLLVLVCVVLACSQLGSFLGALVFGDAPLAKYARNAFALMLAWAFHPLSGLLITRLPEVFDGAMRRFGLKQ